jgi:ATP-dependent DNA helicase RecQ
MNQFSQILTKYWGYSGFRPLQAEIIESVASGKDTLGLMPTGGGKSITFQVFSLSREGVCLVITPLIALMKDQVENLNRRGIKALAIHSGMSALEIKIAIDNAVWGDYKFLYISPERLETQRFRERLKDMKVNLITVDEAHCISQWGYDFRPSYLKITEIRSLLPEVPILALTATATSRVVNDIQEKLQFKVKNLLSKSFARDNLMYLVREQEDKLKYMVQSILKAKGSGIVYVRKRKLTREVAALLNEKKISADFYHAGLKSEIRSQKQEFWTMGKTRVIVATNAFGMGIDKPDVRFVIHLDPPDSIEAYFQEAGRAGRDGENAFAVLLYNNADKLKLKKHINTAFPEIDTIRKVYDAICNYCQVAEGFGIGKVYDFNLAMFAESFRFQVSTVLASLKLLQMEDYLEFTDEVDSPARIHFIVNRDDLYKFQVANASFDGFIKLLLRSYSGLFTEYVNIDEELLAKRAGITNDIAYEFLKRLDAQKIIDFIPRKKTPFIVFNRDRVNTSRLTISKKNYDDRKSDYTKRIEAVIHYSESQSKCRSQILLEYFGEKNPPRCGKCDVCQKRNNLGLNKIEFDQVVQQIKQALITPVTYEKLLFELKGDQEENIKVVRWLLDNEKILFRIDQKLEWNPKS